MWADVLCSMGLVDRDNQRSVHHTHQAFQSLYLAGILILFLTLQESPAVLVIFGQFFSGLFNTPLLMFGICWMAFHTDRRLRMRKVTAALLVGTVIVILICVGVGLVNTAADMMKEPEETKQAADSSPNEGEVSHCRHTANDRIPLSAKLTAVR
jgi:hypothetical protein